jgi:hypothetical protein
MILTRRRVALSALGLAFSLPPQLAAACRVYRNPDERVRAAFDVVVVAAVTSVGFTGPRGPDFHPWQAQARLQRVVEGAPGKFEFTFSGAQSSAACDDRKPPRSAGEVWVLYMRRLDGALRVIEAYPLESMRKVDPRFAGDARAR